MSRPRSRGRSGREEEGGGLHGYEQPQQQQQQQSHDPEVDELAHWESAGLVALCVILEHVGIYAAIHNEKTLAALHVATGIYAAWIAAWGFYYQYFSGYRITSKARVVFLTPLFLIMLFNPIWLMVRVFAGAWLAAA